MSKPMIALHSLRDSPPHLMQTAQKPLPGKHPAPSAASPFPQAVSRTLILLPVGTDEGCTSIIFTCFFFTAHGITKRVEWQEIFIKSR